VVPPNYGEHSADTAPESHGRAKSTIEDSASKRSEAPILRRWEMVKEVILRPSIAGGLVGIVNIGLLAGGSYAFYTQPKLRHDTKMITSAIVATFALFGAESYVAQTCPRPLKENKAYRRGEEDRATSFVCHPAHEPEPMRMSRIVEGTTGIVNAGVLSIVGFLTYKYWDSPNWDRRIVSAASVGLVALLVGEVVFIPWDGIRRYLRPRS